jgi:plastocyanin
MPAMLRFGLSTFISVLSVLVMSIGTVSAAPTVTGRHAAARMDPVTITITITSTSGTVWGSVTAAYTYKNAKTTKTCSTSSCALRIPQGVTARLSQTPTDSSTWPFQSWTVNSKGHTRTKTNASIKLKVTGKTTVSAVYVLAQSSSPYLVEAGASQHRMTVHVRTTGGEYAFSPVKLTVKKGTRVTWVNNTDAPHTVTGQKSWHFSSSTFSPNGKVSTVFNKAGTYHYVCSIHPYMKATIVVKSH